MGGGRKQRRASCDLRHRRSVHRARCVGSDSGGSGGRSGNSGGMNGDLHRIFHAVSGSRTAGVGRCVKEVKGLR